jgi:hypothetical protein
VDLTILKPLVEQIHGCTFATLDALCEPRPGVMERITGERVIIYRTKGSSGYENRVKRALAASGKNPDLFTVGDLPWGTRLNDLPIIEHRGNYYLQTIVLAAGIRTYFLAFSNTPVDPKDFGIRPSRPQLDLSPSDQVIMHTYKIDNIERITLMGETLADTVTADRTRRAILTIKP